MNSVDEVSKIRKEFKAVKTDLKKQISHIEQMRTEEFGDTLRKILIETRKDEEKINFMCWTLNAIVIFGIITTMLLIFIVWIMFFTEPI